MDSLIWEDAGERRVFEMVLHFERKRPMMSDSLLLLPPGIVWRNILVPREFRTGEILPVLDLP